MIFFMKQHGRTIVCSVITVFVIGIVFTIRLGTDTGFIRIAYGKAMQHMTDTNGLTYADQDAVRTVAVRSSPKITYKYTKTVPGKKVNIHRMFFAEDADGNSAVVEITDILDNNGNSVLYSSAEDKKNKRPAYRTTDFLFRTSGIYTLHVKAVDVEKKTAYGQYKLLVTGS